MKCIQAECVLSPGNTLGEGPFSPDGKTLYWFDILEGRAYQMVLSDGSLQSRDMDHFLCCGGSCGNDALLAAGETGIGFYDRTFKSLRNLFHPPFDPELLRFNDGKIAPDGSFWAGSMSFEGDRPIGGLFRFTDTVSCILDGMTIPNGLGWSPDGTSMYITDSGRAVIEKVGL